MRTVLLLAVPTVLFLVSVACSGDDGKPEPTAASSPVAMETPSPQATACSGTIPVTSNSNTGEVRLLSFTGSQVKMSEAIGTSLFHPVLSPDGKRIAYFGVRPAPALWVADADGKNARRLADIVQLHDQNPPVWSPRGDRIAFESARSTGEGARSDVYVVNADGAGSANLTASALSADTPSWSPDGSRVAFVGREAESTNVYVVNADGSGTRRVTNYDSPAYAMSAAWSPDGSVIAYVSNAAGNTDVFIVKPDGTGENNLTKSPTPEFTSPVGHFPVEFSPDGKKVAFLSERDGDLDIYTLNTDGSGLLQLTNEQGSEFRPEWLPDGRCLTFYVSRPSPTGGGQVYAVRDDGTGLVELTTLR